MDDFGSPSPPNISQPSGDDISPDPNELARIRADARRRRNDRSILLVNDPSVATPPGPVGGVSVPSLTL